MTETATRDRFDSLVATWDDETGFLSNMSVACAHPAFREIVAMGETAVPLIVDRLREAPDHLFVALHEITGANPVPEEHRGRIEEISRDWVSWFDARHPSDQGMSP